MKTHNLKLKSLFAIALSVLALVACNKKEDNNAATPTSYQMINGMCYNNQNQVVATTLCTNNGYYMSNGYCYNTAGQIVTTTLCQQTNTGYYMNNGYCYNTAGQIVSTMLCQQTNTGYYMSNGYCYSSTGQIVNTALCTNNGGGIYGQQCYGSYLYQASYWSQMVWCNGSNCRGYTLYEMNSGRSVTCQ